MSKVEMAIRRVALLLLAFIVGGAAWFNLIEPRFWRPAGFDGYERIQKATETPESFCMSLTFLTTHIHDKRAGEFCAHVNKRWDLQKARAYEEALQKFGVTK